MVNLKKLLGEGNCARLLAFLALGDYELDLVTFVERAEPRPLNF
jgi:hypothetical protein